jgi:hypothetical protein
MRASSSVTWTWICVAIVGGACSKSPAAPEKPPAKAAPAPAPATPAPPSANPKPPPTPPAAPVTCTSGDDIDYLAPSGTAAIACFVKRGGKQRDCWRIEPTGAVAALPPAQWPATGSAPEPADDTPETKIGETFVQSPVSHAVKIQDGASDEEPPTIEVCAGGACKRLKLRQEKRPSLQFLHSLVVHPDGHTIFAGLGMGTTGAEAIDRYDLDKPAAAPQRLKFPNRCAWILDVLAGNLLLQTSDCANLGGARVLMTPGGKQLANLGEFASHQSFHALGGNRWLFESYAGLAIWDLATGKRVAAAKHSDDASPPTITIVNGAILAVELEGKITGYDAALKPKALGAVPRCP